MQSIVMLSVSYAMLNAIYAECHMQALYAECHAEALYVECQYVECQYAQCRGTWA
jgi:hypothetical protein